MNPHWSDEMSRMTHERDTMPKTDDSRWFRPRRSVREAAGAIGARIRREGGREPGQEPGQVPQFLQLVSLAFRDKQACLYAEPPATGAPPGAEWCGWSGQGAAGAGLRPSGECVGFIAAEPGQEPRVSLYPPSAYAAAAAAAARRGCSLPFTLPQLSAEMHGSGLLVPGSGDRGDPRSTFPFWKMPASALLPSISAQSSRGRFPRQPRQAGGHEPALE
jgi:hypothetical protein